MQQAAFRGLAGKRGGVVAVEPSSGRILALVSSPSYDPGVLSGTGHAVTAAWRRLNTSLSQPMLARAIRQTYPPGSTFKIVTAASLDAGVVTDVDGPTIPSWVAKSNFDTDMSDDQLALSSIGQFDTAATPLQMALVASAVANNGEIAQPHLVERTTTSGGTTVETTGRRSYPQAMSPSTAMRLRELMVRAVEDGTGTNGAIPGAVVGGKTGTAQHGLGNAGTPYAWFIAWAPAADSAQPAVAVAVVMEDAETNRTDISGGGSAAPIARAVMEEGLRLEAEARGRG